MHDHGPTGPAWGSVVLSPHLAEAQAQGARQAGLQVFGSVGQLDRQGHCLGHLHVSDTRHDLPSSFIRSAPRSGP